MTITEFIEKNGITAKTERTDRNPNMDGFNGDHWKVILSRVMEAPLETAVGADSFAHKQVKYRSRLTVPFSKGYGHNGQEPTAAEVLDCLASDASSIENARGFEDWASDFGYDTDSRKAEKTFKACERSAAKLKNFLGEDLYNVLLWKTERE